MLTELHFIRPLWLTAILPVSALCWWILRQQDRMDRWAQFVDPHLLEHLMVHKRKQRRMVPVHFLFIAWIITAIALAGPTWYREPSPFADDEAGLVVLLKTSHTMKTTDIQPSRLGRAKHKLRDLLEQRGEAPTGLIVYSGSAHLVMPLTKDDRIISTMVEDLTPELMPEDGDALDRALKLAVKMMRKTGLPGSLLVMADTVSAQQARAISGVEIDLPVQFLAFQSPSAPVDSGLQETAATLNAPVVKLSVDQADVERIVRRAKKELKTTADALSGNRWNDAGYALLPLIALLALLWSRKGWQAIR